MATATAEIAEPERIETLNFATSGLQVGKPALAMVTATNNYGETVDLYNEVEFLDKDGAEIGPIDPDNLATFVNLTNDIFFHYTGGDGRGDGESKTHINTGDDIADAMSLIGYVQDVMTETTGFVVLGTDKGTANIIATTAGGTSVKLYQYTVSEAATIDAVKGLVEDTTTAVEAESGAAVTITPVDVTTVEFLDSDGDVMSPTMAGLSITDWFYLDKDGVLPTAGLENDNYYVVAQILDDQLEWDNTDEEVLKAIDGAKAGTHNVKVSLYKAKSTTSLGSAISSKTLPFKVFNSADKKITYTASLVLPGTDMAKPMLYVDATGTDAAGFKVTKTDSNGATVEENHYWVVVSGADLPVAGQNVSGQNANITTAGSAVAHIWTAAGEVAQVTIPYDVEFPVGQMVVAVDEDNNVYTGSTFEYVEAIDITGGVVTITANGGIDYTIMVVNQYGNPEDADWVCNGTDLADGVELDAESVNLFTVSDGYAYGYWKVTIGDDDVTVTTTP